jgi:hypothetical protein
MYVLRTVCTYSKRHRLYFILTELLPLTTSTTITYLPFTAALPKKRASGRTLPALAINPSVARYVRWTRAQIEQDA